MKFYKFLRLLLVIILISSCNTEEKKRAKERTQERVQEEKEFDKFIDKYEPIYLDNDYFNYKFSYELEQAYLNKNIAYAARINDVIKINDDKYILHAIGENRLVKNPILKLEINKKLVEKIIKYRSQILSSEDTGSSAWINFKFSRFIFIMKPNAINKNFGLYKSVDDSYIEENELIDYSINLEIDNGNFIINAKCLDLMLANKFFIVSKKN